MSDIWEDTDRRIDAEELEGVTVDDRLAEAEVRLAPRPNPALLISLEMGTGETVQRLTAVTTNERKES